MDVTDFEIRLDCVGVDWAQVARILKDTGMAHFEPDTHRRAFENSHTVVFVYGRQGELVGVGRAICDGAYQAAVYDVAVLPAYQGRGLGRLIMERVLDRLAGCNVILYASPGKEDFYRRLGFGQMLTGMALFRNPERMRERGFVE